MSDTVRVGLVGLGTIGSHAARLLLDERSTFDLVGACTLEPDAHGAPLGEFVGASTAGPAISPRLDDVLALDPDVVVLATQSFLPQVLTDVEACVHAGANLVSCNEELAYPFRRHPDLAQTIDSLARQRNVTVLGTGVNPGYLFDSLLALSTGVCWDVQTIRGRRVVDVSGFAEGIHRRLGIGYTAEEFQDGHDRGTIAGHVGFPESIELVFETMGLALDDVVVEEFDPLVAETPAPTRYGELPPGRTEGFVQRAIGRRQGRDFVTLELVLHLRPEAAGFELQDTIDVEGAQPVHLSLRPGPDALLATSAQLVNSIPSVLAAPAGLRTVAETAPAAAWVGSLQDAVTARRRGVTEP